MDKVQNHSLPLLDTHQSAWQLAVIQLSGWISLPTLATSIIILQINSFLGAVLTITVGNILVLLVRFGIIAMSVERRQSTLDISHDYLGKMGHYFVAILLLVSTFAWFTTQTTSASTSITQLLPIRENQYIDQFIQVSVFLGGVSTLFCMGGIVLLRKLSTFCFPILVIGFFVILYLAPDKTFYNNAQPLSLAGLTLVLATNLGITADLPTFFRHSRSARTSIQALIIIQVISLGLGLCSLFLGSIISKELEITREAVLLSVDSVLRYSIIGFIFLSVVCANVANVYSASVGWELVAPKALVGRKELFIIGLGLTTVFVLITGVFSFWWLLNFSDTALVNLSIVLVSGYVIYWQRKKLPDFFEQTTYFIAWILAVAVNMLQYFGLIFPEYSPIAVGLIVILAVIFSLFVGRRMRKTISI